jgi:hypothetical protein
MTSEQFDILKLREKTFQNLFVRNTRPLILGIVYIVAFVLASFFAPSIAHNYRGSIICFRSSFDSAWRAFHDIYVYFFSLPLLYFLLMVTTCISDYFGGETDPLLGKLTDKDLARLRLIKQVTLLKCLVDFFFKMHSTSFLYLPKFLYEVLRFLGFVAILSTTFLFYQHENIFSKLRERFLGGATRNGETTDVTKSRRSNFIFKGDDDASNVDYTNLIENDN